MAGAAEHDVWAWILIAGVSLASLGLIGRQPTVAKYVVTTVGIMVSGLSLMQLFIGTPPALRVVLALG